MRASRLPRFIPVRSPYIKRTNWWENADSPKLPVPVAVRRRRAALELAYRRAVRSCQRVKNPQIPGLRRTHRLRRYRPEVAVSIKAPVRIRLGNVIEKNIGRAGPAYPIPASIAKANNNPVYGRTIGITLQADIEAAAYASRPNYGPARGHNIAYPEYPISGSSPFNDPGQNCLATVAVRPSAGWKCCLIIEKYSAIFAPIVIWLATLPIRICDRVATGPTPSTLRLRIGEANPEGSSACINTSESAHQP